MSDEELMEKIKNIQGLLWRPFIDELLIRSKKWFEDRDKTADRIEQLERERDAAVATLRILAAFGSELARAVLAALEGGGERDQKQGG
jgi:hypothetical protein